MNRFHILTLGCPKNTVDSERLQRMLEAEGLSRASEEEADILIVNTCAFINDAKEESIRETLRLAKMKEASPQKSLILFGCLAQRYRDELAAEMPEIDSIIGVGNERAVVDFCKGISAGSEAKPDVSLRRQAQSSNRCFAYLKIAEGCDRRCTFCVIPSIRGRFKSAPPDEILKDAEALISSGIKELILIGQDITEYGKDLRGYRLVNLLKQLVSLKVDFSIRLLYMNPSGISNELLDMIASEDKILKYLDIPMQHSEDRLIRLMGRQGARKEYLRLLRRIRKSIPGATIRTTFIVGFPSETEEEFQGLLDFIEEARFDRLGAFKYSREEGTTAARLKGQMTRAIKDRRYDALMGAQASISFEKNRELIGRRFNAIVDECGDDAIIARIYSQAPDIDGATIIDLRKYPSLNDKQSIKIGSIITVEIVDAYEYDLLGKICEGANTNQSFADMQRIPS